MIRAALQGRFLEQRARVAGPDPDPLGELLATHVAMCWTRLYLAETCLSQAAQSSPERVPFCEARLTAAAARFRGLLVLHLHH